MDLVAKIVKKRTKCSHFSGPGRGRKSFVGMIAVRPVQSISTEVGQVTVNIRKGDGADELDANVAYVDLIQGTVRKSWVPELLHIAEEIAQVQIIFINGFENGLSPFRGKTETPTGSSASPLGNSWP